MTSFESFFNVLKKALGNNELYEVWPDFEPQCEKGEYMWTILRGLGEVLILNCGRCDGPSDLRHNRCRDCVDSRKQLAKDMYQRATGQEKQKWETLLLCRIHHE